VSGGAAQIHKSSFGQHDHSFSVQKLPSGHHVFNHLFLDSGHFRQPSHVDFVVEVTDVADYRVVFHSLHVARHYYVLVSSRGDENVHLFHH
jgi:hypothetical protein